MSIYVKQLDPVSLTAFIQSVSTGSSLSGGILAYVQGSGFLGSTVVWTTGGNQSIAGAKTFATGPIVPYYTSTGAAVAAQWILDQLGSVSGTLTGSSVTLNTAQTIVAPKTFTYAVSVASPSGALHAVNLAFLTGVSGALAGGAGGSSVIVTGSAPITPARFSGAGNVVATYDGTQIIFSGTAAGGGGSTPPGIVYQTGDQLVSGFKVFTGSIWAAAPTAPSGLTNAAYVSGLSGALQVQITGMTGYNVYNTYFITGTGTVNLNYTATGSINNTFNDTTNNFVTGNYINLSAYADQYNLYTGLAFWEAYVGRTFTATGYAVGGQTSGTQGFLSGSFYQRTPTNAKVNFLDFSLNSGLFVYASGGFAQTVTGLNRVGIDIYLIGTGLTGVTFGLFGVGT